MTSVIQAISPAVDTTARILLVDDEDANLRLFASTLRRAGYTEVHRAKNGVEALELFERIAPDAILLDLHMPVIDGFAILETIRRLQPDTYLPVIVLTADITVETKRRALAAGATDFLTKPADVVEIVLRVGNMLETRRLHQQLAVSKQQLAASNLVLERRVRERTDELERAQLEIIDRLAMAAEYRDDATNMHTKRVGVMSRATGLGLGMSDGDAELLGLAAPLHDIGKIGIPDSILLKPGRLTDDEFEVIKRHTTMGAAILSGSSAKVLQLAEEIALAHHERWDGTGYAGLAGEAIPLRARIVSVCDVYDALISVRPYKKPWPIEAAVAEIDGQRGRHFDPLVVEAFLDVVAAHQAPVDGRPAA